MRKFSITSADKSETRYWGKQLDASLEDFVSLLSRHDIRDKKDGGCFMPGKLAGTSRKAAAVVHIDALIYDIDGHQSLSEVLDLLVSHGKFAVVYSSHNHKTTSTTINVDKYEKWADKAKAPTKPPTAESLVQFLAENGKGHLTNVVFSPEASRSEFWAHTEDGMVWIVKHDPVDKFRVVIPLQDPIVLSDLDIGTTRAILEYKRIYHGVGQALGLRYDNACEDPSRMYYWPSCRDSDKDKLVVEGCNVDFNNPSLLNWRDYPRVDIPSSKTNRQGTVNTPVSELVITDSEGVSVNLHHWERRNRDFDIETLLRYALPEEMQGTDRSNGGFHVECPHSSEHSTTKLGGTFCANGDDDHSWQIYCSHVSCKSAGRKKLDFLAEYIRMGYVTAKDIGVESSPDIPDKGVIASTLGVDLDTLPAFTPKDIGFDLPEVDDPVDGDVFHEDDSFSKEDLYDVCRKDISGATTVLKVKTSLARMAQRGCEIDYDDIVEMLAISPLSGKALREVIGLLARRNFIDKERSFALIRDLRESKLPLTEAIVELQKNKYAGATLFAEWDRLANHYLVDSLIVETMYQKHQQELFIQEHGPNINREIQLLNKRYAKMVDSGSARFLDMAESRAKGEPVFVSQAQLSLNLKNRNETFIIEGRKNNKTVKVFAYDRWIEDSKEIKEFSGITFQPGEGEIIDGMFNIWSDSTGYKGFHITPKPGDCSLILNHIREVWCSGDQTLYNWVMTWFSQIVQRPWDKASTAIVLLGDEGSGKSVIMENGFARILGYMYGGSGDREDVVGRWTSNLFGKLLWLSEETLFAGDKKAMNILKDRIAADKIGIEYKFATKFRTPSYVRFVFTSNQLHALNLSPKDRRFCVLNTTNKYQQDSEYFSDMREYLRGDGAAHLFHYLLTFKPEDVGLTWRSLWTPPYTEGKRQQAEMSYEAADSFFIEILKYGRITDTPSSVFLDERVSWPLQRNVTDQDTSFTIKPSKFKSAYDAYLRYHAPSTAKFDRNKFTANFAKYFGMGRNMTEFNKVVKKHGESSRFLILPYRKDLLDYAVKMGYLTEAEKLEALDSPDSHFYNDHSDVL